MSFDVIWMLAVTLGLIGAGTWALTWYIRYLDRKYEGRPRSKPVKVEEPKNACRVCGAGEGKPCDSTAAAFYSVEVLDRYPSWGPGEQPGICPRQ